MGLGEIRSNWAQFLAIIAIGAIAVTLFVGLLANAEVFSLRVDETYAAGNMADIWVTTSEYQEEDEENLRSILGDRGSLESRFEAIAQAGSRSIYAIVEDDEPTISAPYDLQKGEDDTSSYYVRIDEALSGHEEENDGFYDIGMPFDVTYDLSSYADELSLFSSLFGSNPFPNGSITLSFTVTGIMKYPENICKASYNSSAVLISQEAFMGAFEDLLDSSLGSSMRVLVEEALASSDLRLLIKKDEGYAIAPNQYLATVEEDGDLEAVEDGFQTYFDAKTVLKCNNLYSLNDRENMAYVLTVKNDVDQALQFTFLFPFVFFFVALLVILTTTSQLILKERSQIGTMKAIGLKRREILLFYMGITFALVALGTIIGEILGPIIIPAIMNQKYAIIYTLPTLTYHFPVLYGVLTAVVFLGVSILVTYLIARKEVALKPSESMRPKPANFKTRGSKKAKNPNFLSFRMAFRNMRIDIVKSIMVVVGVLGCTALLVCGFGIEDTIYYGVEHDRSLANNADLTLSLTSEKSRADLESDVAGNQDILSFQMFTKATSTISSPLTGLSASSSVYIVEPSESEHFLIQGEIDHGGIAISSKIAETIGASYGESVSFTYGALPYEGEILSVFDAFVYNGIIIYGDSTIFSSPVSAYSSAMVDFKEGVDPASGKERLVSSLSYVLSAKTQSEWEDYLNDIMQGVLIMTAAVKIFAILLALVVLYNLTLMNFKERQRDIATLKVLGFNLKEIGLSLIIEAMTLTAIGVLCGLFAGIPFLYGVLTLNKVELIMYIIHVDVSSFFIAFALTFGVALLINLFFAHKARKVKMVESLKSVE